MLDKEISVDVPVKCDCCDGNRYIEVINWKTNKDVKVKCPICNGQGYILMEEW